MTNRKNYGTMAEGELLAAVENLIDEINAAAKHLPRPLHMWINHKEFQLTLVKGAYEDREQVYPIPAEPRSNAHRLEPRGRY